MAAVPAHLLLVDDDPDMVPLVQDLLADAPESRWQVAWAPNGDEALRLLAQRRFDAALVDYRLGSMTGVDLVALARAEGIRTPVVMFTDVNDRRVDLAAMEVGADDFVRKADLSADVLERALRYAVRHAASRQSVEERESRFRALIEQASDAIVLVNAEGIITFASESVQRVTGLLPAEMVGRDAFGRIHPGDLPTIRKQLCDLMQVPGGRVAAQYRARHADGSWRYRELSAANRLDDPAVRAVVVTFRDVTDRQIAQLQHDHLASIVQSSRDAILSIALDGTIRSWNAAAEQLYGYSAAEAIGRSSLMLVAAEERDAFNRLLHQLSAGGSVQALEQRRIRKDGTAIWVSLTVSPVRDHTGAVAGASSVARDITSEVTARRALVDQEREYRSLFDESPVGLARASVDGVWQDVNFQLCKSLGYSRAELIGVDFATLTHPDDRAAADASYQQLRDGTSRAVDEERRYRTKDGSYRWMRVRISPYQDAAGAVQYFIVALTDVTSRRVMEEELRGHVARLHAMLAHLPISIWMLDPAGTVTMSEGRLLSRFGAQPGDLVGKSQMELFRELPDVVESTRRALAGESVHHTTRIGDGVYEAFYTPMHDEVGQFLGTVGISIEITERVRLEEQFRQAQKMEAVGLLAGGVAHDFNNILTAILGFGDMMMDGIAEGDRHHYELTQILRAAHSASSLTRQLLAFSRRQVMQPRVLDLRTAILSMHALLSRVIGEDIKLETTFDARNNVFADPGQIEQIILNLAVNARDAMPQGGRLTVRTSDMDVDQYFVATHRGATVGPHVRLDVTDTGVGMTEEVRRRIFEPFFTTKERGRGTGLGLATVYGIVKQSGGSIWVKTEPGKGTTFTVLFPVATGDVEADSGATAPKPSTPAGKATILVVEDQDEVRTIARMLLKRHGYDVIEAADPEAAVALVSAADKKPALLFTDVVMPGMSGRELALRLQSVAPQMKVLYTSGYTDDAMATHGVLEPGLSFLPKPYTVTALLTMIRELLG